MEMMPPKTADLATSWAFLEKRIDLIMDKGREGVSPIDYQSMHTVTYNFFTHNITRKSQVPFYEAVVQYFVNHVKSIREKCESLQDEQLLQYYAATWDRYTTGAKYVDRILSYLNRYWVSRERDEGELEIYPVYTIALVSWRDNVFLPLQKTGSKITSVVLHLIERERDGEPIEEGLIKKLVDSYVSLDVDDSDLERTCLGIYKYHFESQFIAATETYYKRELESFLAQKYTVSGYLEKVVKRLEEEERIGQYLNPQTREAHIRKCESVLIREEVIRNGIPQLSESEHGEEDLKRMHALLSRIPADVDS